MLVLLVTGNIRANSKIIDNKSNIEFNETLLYTYRCGANGTVLVNKSCENEFILITASEIVRPESLTNGIF